MHGVHQGREVREPADFFENAAAFQLFGDGNFIERLAPVEELHNRLIDRLMDVRVEIRRLHYLGDHGHDLPIDQNRTEQGHLRL